MPLRLRALMLASVLAVTAGATSSVAARGAQRDRLAFESVSIKPDPAPFTGGSEGFAWPSSTSGDSFRGPETPCSVTGEGACRTPAISM